MNKLGLLGPEHTFHDIARKKFIPHFEAHYLNTFDEIFTALKSKRVQKALIAISNSIAGEVEKNGQTIERMGFQTIETFQIPIHLHLASRLPNTIESMRKVYSHPMAIKETQAYFSKYSHLKFVATASTAGAIEELLNQNEQGAGVIASAEAIEESKLLLIAKHIEDAPNNTTTFALIE